MSGAIITGKQDELYAYNTMADDIDSAVLYYSLEVKPDGMSINESGTIEWTPTNDQVGDNRVKVIVSDGELSASQEFYITVENVNDAPYILPVLETSVLEDSQ